MAGIAPAVLDNSFWPCLAGNIMDADSVHLVNFYTFFCSTLSSFLNFINPLGRCTPFNG